jgi:hypothetical protein
MAGLGKTVFSKKLRVANECKKMKNKIYSDLFNIVINISNHLWFIQHAFTMVIVINPLLLV